MIKQLGCIAATIAALQASATAAPSPKALFDDGQEAYDKADYATAIAKWEESYRLSGAHLLLFALAEAHRHSGSCTVALATYRRFVAVEPTASERSRADEAITKLSAECGHHAATGASFWSGRNEERVGLASASGGALLLVVGLGFGIEADSLGEQVNNCTQRSPCIWAGSGGIASKDATGRRDATVGRVLDVVGLAALVGGAALYYLGMRDTELGVAPVAARLGERGGVLTWSRSW